VFGEPVGWRRWLAIAIGFVGVLIIVRPGTAGFNEFSLLALSSVAFCTLRDLATRRIPTEIPSLFIALLTTLTVTTGGTLIMFPLGGWTPPSGRAVGMLAVAAILLMIGYQCIISALRTGEISAVAPFRYTALLWAMLFGYLVFGDQPDRYMLIGAAIIVLSGPLRFLPRTRAQPLASCRDGFRYAAGRGVRPPDCRGVPRRGISPAPSSTAPWRNFCVPEPGSSLWRPA
jgi:drug/metabolite transporter (DMT)-like permease